LTTISVRRAYASRPVEPGAHAELLDLGGVYASLYEHQFRGEPERRAPDADADADAVSIFP
jgi:hypothetical protein